MSRLVQIGHAAWTIFSDFRANRGSWVVVLFEECSKLGGVYIKFLQQLAITEAYSEYFAAYTKRLDVFDRVEVEPLDIVSLLKAELGSNIDQIRNIETQPFATGSFAQVYRAKLSSTGEEVVIKAQRPSVSKTLAIDTRLLTLTSYVIQPFMRSGLVNLPSITKEFISSVKLETDYVREVAMANYLFEYFAKRSRGVVIPKTYDSLSTRRIIVQQYIYGLPLTSVVKYVDQGRDAFDYVYQNTGSDLSKQMIQLGVEQLSATLYADFIMSDPHPGNIVLLGDNKVALIDFGLVASAPIHRGAYLGMISQYRALYEDRVDMGSLAVAMLAFYDYKLYEALSTVAKNHELMSSLSSYISRTTAGTLLRSNSLVNKKLISQLFLKEINANNRFGIRINSRDVVLQKAMHNYLSTVRMVCGENNRERYYSPIIKSALIATENDAYRLGVEESRYTKAEMSLEEAREIVLDWLSQIAENNQGMYSELTKGEIEWAV